MKKIAFFILFSYCFILSHQDKIKLYGIYTPSHEVLKNEFFLPSLQDDFELVLQAHDQTCTSTQFMGEGWTDTTIKKVDLIIRAIEENWGDVFIFSDVDIQFFAPIEKIILSLMKDYDIIMQRNNPAGVLCTGFFACRANEKTLALWKDVKQNMQKDKEKSDQITFNQCIKSKKKDNPYGIKWNYLPPIFFGGGTLTGRLWFPGQKLAIPKGIVLHHANWTRGIKNKIAQLNYVKNKVEKVYSL
jgi:hypothetical protein